MSGTDKINLPSELDAVPTVVPLIPIVAKDRASFFLASRTTPSIVFDCPNEKDEIQIEKERERMENHKQR